MYLSMDGSIEGYYKADGACPQIVMLYEYCFLLNIKKFPFYFKYNN